MLKKRGSLGRQTDRQRRTEGAQEERVVPVHFGGDTRHQGNVDFLLKLFFVPSVIFPL